jgi:hypothetical protein
LTLALTLTRRCGRRWCHCWSTRCCATFTRATTPGSRMSCSKSTRPIAPPCKRRHGEAVGEAPPRSTHFSLSGAVTTGRVRPSSGEGAAASGVWRAMRGETGVSTGRDIPLFTSPAACNLSNLVKSCNSGQCAVYIYRKSIPHHAPTPFPRTSPLPSHKPAINQKHGWTWTAGRSLFARFGTLEELRSPEPRETRVPRHVPCSPIVVCGTLCVFVCVCVCLCVFCTLE